MSLSVDTMRTIDRWVGVPLCALVSPFVALIDGVKKLLGTVQHALLRDVI